MVYYVVLLRGSYKVYIVRSKPSLLTWVSSTAEYEDTE